MMFIELIYHCMSLCFRFESASKPFSFRGRSLETCRRSEDEDCVSAAFIKNKWFWVWRFLISHEHEKKLVSVSNTEWLTVKRGRCWCGVLQYERPSTFFDQRGHLNILLVDRNGWTRLNHLLHSPYYFFPPLEPVMLGLYNAVGAYDVHKWHCINLKVAHDIVNALASV